MAAEDPPIFPPSLLSSGISGSSSGSDSAPAAQQLAQLPDGFTIRPLHKSDFHKGYLDCLRVLTWVGDLSEEEWGQRYDEMAAAKGTYYLLAMEFEGKVVGTGSLVVERKFIHNRGLVGHVEEIAISTAHQGKGLGLAMLAAIDGVGKAVGCYKNILNCGDKNEPFYVKCGYYNSGIEMSRYFEAPAKDDFHRG